MIRRIEGAAYDRYYKQLEKELGVVGVCAGCAFGRARTGRRQAEWR